MYNSRGIIIKQFEVKVLDENDQEFIKALQSLNIPRNMAALITYLANVNEASTREIEIGAGLRQPEVSTGIRTMHENNWITERCIRIEGKGRPTKIYKLRVPIEKIIQHYENEKKIEAAKIMQAIQRLREIAST